MAKIKNDIIFIGALVLLLAIIGGAVLIFRQEGSTVIVKVNNEVYGKYSLNEDRVVEIISEKGYNILVIENGKAYVSDASCPGKDAFTKCTNQRAISYSGQHIFCNENMVEIAIEGKINDEGLDIIS